MVADSILFACCILRNLIFFWPTWTGNERKVNVHRNVLHPLLDGSLPCFDAQVVNLSRSDHHVKDKGDLFIVDQRSFTTKIGSKAYSTVVASDALRGNFFRQGIVVRPFC